MDEDPEEDESSKKNSEQGYSDYAESNEDDCLKFIKQDMLFGSKKNKTLVESLQIKMNKAAEDSFEEKL